MKTKFKSFIFFLIGLFYFNQLLADEEQRNVGSFKGIVLSVPAKLKLHQGDAQPVKIIAKGEILKDIITEIKDDKLVIRFPHLFSLRKAGEIEINITTPSIESLSISGSGAITTEGIITTKLLEVKISGSGEIKMDQLAAQEIKVAISGSGGVSLKGEKTVNLMEIDLSGSGSLTAKDLSVENVNLLLSGSGNCSVNVQKKLRIKSSGSGVIFYKGDPEIQKKISGATTLVHLK